MALDNADDIGISHSSTPTIKLKGHLQVTPVTLTYKLKQIVKPS